MLGVHAIVPVTEIKNTSAPSPPSQRRNIAVGAWQIITKYQKAEMPAKESKPMVKTEEKLLYQIPKGSLIWFKPKSGKRILLTFKNLDGMYSYCTTSRNGVVHLSANTPLVKGKDEVYEIVNV
jgi:hypothetical protein